MYLPIHIKSFLQTLVPSAVLIAASAATRADAVLDWNSAALDAIRAARTTPQFASRNLAITHLAIHDAVQSLHPTHQTYLAAIPSPQGASPEAAAVAAAYTVLTNLFPAQSAALTTQWDKSLAAIPANQAREDGIATGIASAKAILNARANDGSTRVVPYVPDNTPGRWRPTPPANAAAQLPQWPFVTPFALPRGDLFRPAGPVSLTSAQWTFDFNQVKSLGDTNSTTRTPDQTQIARFWLDGAGTMTPPGHWNLVAQTVAKAKSLTLPENAHLFALLNLSLADAAIAAWDAKYNTFPFWRPITAIREADTDGNPDTVADPSWTPLVATPPHPDYVSGHATFSGAAARVLSHYFGRDDIAFTVGSDDLPGVQRSFPGFADCMREIGMSRIYAGIHTLTTIVDGFALGRSVANLSTRNFLLPIAAAAATLEARKTPNATQIELRVSGAPGDVYALESSANGFNQWLPLQSLPSPGLYLDAVSAETGQKFYRALRPTQGF